MVASGTASEADLHTSSLEERARTLDAVPADRHATPMAGPAPGDVLKDRFLLEERVARGPNGQLFRAADQRLDAAGECGNRVALKNFVMNAVTR